MEGVDKEAIDFWRDTPLHLAAKKDNVLPPPSRRAIRVEPRRSKNESLRRVSCFQSAHINPSSMTPTAGQVAAAQVLIAEGGATTEALTPQTLNPKPPILNPQPFGVEGLELEA